MGLRRFYYILHPRPAYAIGSGSVDQGVVNFMAASWVMPVSSSDPYVALACNFSNYTFTLIERYGQFSINAIGDYELLWRIGSVSGREIDKVRAFRISYVRGRSLDVPVMKNALGVMEVKVTGYIDAGDHRLYVGRVVDYYGDFEEFGLKEFWRVPLHRAGRAFALIDRNLVFARGGS